MAIIQSKLDFYRSEKDGIFEALALLIPLLTLACTREDSAKNRIKSEKPQAAERSAPVKNLPTGSTDSTLKGTPAVQEVSSAKPDTKNQNATQENLSAMMTPPEKEAKTQPPLLSDDVSDFLIQKVCIDSAGIVEKKDPALCSSGSRRNLNPDEKSPYSKTDMGPGFETAASQGWQRSDSFPLIYDGKQYVVKTFDYGGPRMPDFKWGKFEDHQDGFDVAEILGDYISYIATKDGGSDNYWAGRGCKLDDGWVLFPIRLISGQQGSIAHDIFKVELRETCNLDARNQANAAWHRLPNKLTYSGGQILETITTHHWEHPVIADSSSFEKNYYTREYGATRWESWMKCQPNKECSPNVSANECNGEKTGVINGDKWVREGCRDWTFIKIEDREFPTEWANLVKHRLCLNASGRFGDGKTCL